MNRKYLKIVNFIWSRIMEQQFISQCIYDNKYELLRFFEQFAFILRINKEKRFPFSFLITS